jgi:hypothetical protein
MSVQLKSPEQQETELAALEAEAVKQLEAGEAQATDQGAQDDQEGERETPESASTTDAQTTDVKPTDGETTKPTGDEPSGTPEVKDESRSSDDTDTGEGQPSDKAQSRQHQLAQKLAEAQAEIDRLRRASAPKSPVTVPSPSRVQPSKLPWETDDNGDVTLTPDQLNQMVSEEATKTVNHQLEVRDITTQLSIDISDIERNYDELNPDKPEFNQKLSDFIADSYKLRVKENKRFRLSDYAKTIMDLRNEAAEKAKVERDKTIRRQANSQPIMGSTQTTTQASVEDMLGGAKTIEELDEIAQRTLPQGN